MSNLQKYGMPQVLPNVVELQTVIDKLSKYDQKFAKDLVDAFTKYGHLTSNQLLWVQKLIDRANAPKIEQPPVSLGNFQGIVDLFNKAKEHLKYPKIILQVDGVYYPIKVYLSVAGKSSAYPGMINVMGEGKYPTRPYYGRIGDGIWIPSLKLDKVFMDKLVVLLKEFAQNPAEVAMKYGKLTGSCCFCMSPLTDKHSTAAGFGPVCAEHYGLKDQWKNAAFKLVDSNDAATEKIETHLGPKEFDAAFNEFQAIENSLLKMPLLTTEICYFCDAATNGKQSEGFNVCDKCYVELTESVQVAEDKV